jgi:hypothetical protein
MRKHSFVLTVIVLMTVTSFVFAKPGKNGKFKVKPSTVDPDDTDLIVSGWVTHQGLPDSGKSNHALYFQKDDLSSGTGYAYGKIKPFQGRDAAELLELGFDFLNGGHCTANAPRFDVDVDGVIYSVGCTAGVASPAPDDPVNWTRVRFTVTELSAAGVPATGTIQSLGLVFDEGTDVGTGSILLDNVDVNGILRGKPGNGGPKK